MTDCLNNLIAEARALANDNPCTTVGHAWKSEGGRRCPHAGDDDSDDGCGASQAVYVCARCGQYDYGESGGPGAADCAGGDCCGPVKPHRRYHPWGERFGWTTEPAGGVHG